jgi:ParG
MTKTPFRMPQRTATPTVKLDQWVSGAEGLTAEKTPQPERPAGKVARLTIDLPAELHARFKAACALKGTRMIDEVRQLIDEWTQKNS